jgi:hypothetical protein
VAEEEEAGVVTAAMGEVVAVEVMVAVEGAGVVEAAAVEVMVAAEGMVIVEVVVEAVAPDASVRRDSFFLGPPR